MNKALLTTIALLMSAMLVSAQKSIKLPYSRNIEKKNGKWAEWSKTWESEKTLNGYIPILYVKKLDTDIYELQIDYGGSSSGIFKEKVVYDPSETAKVRKSNSKNTLTVYRYTGSTDNYLWTDNITLNEIASTPSKWTSNKDAKIYIWDFQQGSASLYSAQASLQEAQKYKVNFKATKSLIKGTWADWSSWKTIPSNSYFELKIITENRVYNFKYYEGGKVVKDYNITYDSDKTKTIREKIKNSSAYKIDGGNNEWVYLQNTTMGNIFANPDKWANEKDAVILISDYKMSGNQTRIK